MRNNFRADIQAVDEDTAVINLVGDLTAFADQPIQEAYNHVSNDGFKNVIFQIVENYTVCSPGIAALIHVIIKAQKKNQTLLMVIPNTHFQRILAIMGITQQVSVVGSLEEAKRQIL